MQHIFVLVWEMQATGFLERNNIMRAQMEFIASLDGNVLLWIQENLRTDFWDPVALFVTRLGDGGAIWLIASAVMLCFPQSRKTGILTLAALLASLIVNNLIIKNLVARPRPWMNVEGLTVLINKPKDYSFPSAHTSSSFAAAVVICKNATTWGMYSWKTSVWASLAQKVPFWQSPSWRLLSCSNYSWIGIAALIIALGIALSRLYIGVHYPSDVICGALSGIIIALVLCRMEGNRLPF